MTRESTLDLAAAARLLELGRRPTKRGLDLLLEELEHGPDRYEALLFRGPLGPIRSLQLLSGELTLDELVACKELCQREIAHRDLDRHRAASATYFGCVAAGLVHHGEKLTRQSTVRVQEALEDLCIATEGPWLKLFRRAVDAVSDLGVS